MSPACCTITQHRRGSSTSHRRRAEDISASEATRKLAKKFAVLFFDMCVQKPELLRGWRGGFDSELLALLRLVGVLFLERWMTWENRRLVGQAKLYGQVVKSSPKIKVLTVLGWITVVSSYVRR